MYGTYAAPTSKTKKVLQKTQCITKGAAKSTDRRTAKCHLLHGFFMYSITKSKVLLKKTVEWCYILTYLHTDTLHPYTGAARVPMYYQRCSKRTSGATHIYLYISIYIFMYLHYILTGAAMYHQRCCKKYLPVLTAQVLPKYQCTT